MYLLLEEIYSQAIKTQHPNKHLYLNDILNILSQRISDDFMNTKDRLYIDFISFNVKCPNAQLREQDAKIQITQAEHYRDSDIKLVFEQVLLNNAYWQSTITKNDLKIEYTKYRCLMKTKFWLTSPC